MHRTSSKRWGHRHPEIFFGKDLIAVDELKSLNKKIYLVFGVTPPHVDFVLQVKTPHITYSIIFLQTSRVAPSFFFFYLPFKKTYSCSKVYIYMVPNEEYFTNTTVTNTSNFWRIEEDFLHYYKNCLFKGNPVILLLDLPRCVKSKRQKLLTRSEILS